MNLSLASLFSFGAGQFEKKDSFFLKWPLILLRKCYLTVSHHFAAALDQREYYRRFPRKATIIEHK